MGPRIAPRRQPGQGLEYAVEVEGAQAGAVGQVFQGGQGLGLFDMAAGGGDQVRICLLYTSDAADDNTAV